MAGYAEVRGPLLHLVHNRVTTPLIDAAIEELLMRIP
jgi:hypothetical protein